MPADVQTFWVPPLRPVKAQTVDLPAADQIGIAVIQPVVCCFKTTEDFDEKRFVDGLQAAAAGVAWEIPWLAGKVTFVDQTMKKIQCVVPNNPKVEVRIKRSHHYDANELDIRHWPVHIFSHHEFCLAPRPTFGIGTYNFGVQATLMRGGVAVVLHKNHTILDGSAQAMVDQIFARYLSLHMDGKPAPTTPSMPPEALDKSTAYGTHPARPILDWKDWRRAPPNKLSEEAATVAMMQKLARLTFTVWYLSPEKQAQLRAASQETGKPKLSMATCYSTWLWRTFARARGHGPETVSRMLTPCQTRGRVKEVHPSYSGSALVYGRTKATGAELRSTGTYELGQRIANSIKWWTPERIREYWGSIEDHVEKENVSTLQSNTDRDFGTDVEFSNNTHNPFYSIYWGRGLDLRRMRLTNIAFTDGWAIVAPRHKDGGQELYLYSAKDTFVKIIADHKFREYAEYRCAHDESIDQLVANTPVNRAKL